MEETKKKEPKLNLVQMSTLYKIVIPAEVEAKIRFICNKVWNVEWSGTLFYTYSGSFENGDLVITAKDIYVMDIGTSGYTEFDMSPSVISYMTEHPELLDCQMGLIHSHNNMPTFFSDTDTGTLEAEGKDRNHFVSLIVNNAGKYTAAITRFVKATRDIRESFEYDTFEDEHKESSRQYYDKVERLEYYKLKIIKEDVTGFDELNTQLEGIKQAKNTPAKTPALNANGYNYYGGYGPTPIKSASKPIQTELPFDDDETKMSTEEDIHFDEETMKGYALQLVTGSIVIPNSSNIDIEKWINSMPSVYKRRFGEGKEGLHMYELWISMLVEFVVTYAEDENLQIAFEDEQVYSILAQDLVTYLSHFTQNDYLKVITDELLNYIV